MLYLSTVPATACSATLRSGELATQVSPVVVPLVVILRRLVADSSFWPVSVLPSLS